MQKCFCPLFLQLSPHLFMFHKFLILTWFLPRSLSALSSCWFLVVEQSDRSVRLKCCCESLFSSVKHVKSKNCSIHTWKSMHSRCAFKAESPRGHKFWAAYRCRQRGPQGPPWTWVDDHYLHHTYQSKPANHMNTWTWKVLLPFMSWNSSIRSRWLAEMLSSLEQRASKE